MNNTTIHFQHIPPEKFRKKLWKTLVGLAMGAAGYLMVRNGIGSTVLGSVFIGVGGFLVAGDFVRAALPMGKDLVNFAAWAIRKLKGAVRNGK